ncbi:MAG TPA: VOC family protein [Devosia sp.]|nr:VOC family protein [Devosia sp.]
MFADRTVTAMVPARDLNAAIRWYEDKLGLKPSGPVNEGGAAYSLAGGTRFFLYTSQFAGTAQHTVIAFDTADLAADMLALRGRGVVFEDYDLPGLKTVGGVATFGTVKNAWFKDADGNIIGLAEGM